MRQHHPLLTYGARTARTLAPVAPRSPLARPSPSTPDSHPRPLNPRPPSGPPPQPEPLPHPGRRLTLLPSSGRAALRLATLAVTLPRARTRLTSAGRSQLVAYLFHDSVFSLASAALAAALPPALRGDGLAALARALPAPLAAVLLLLAYTALCLAVQLLLSQPGWLRRACAPLCCVGHALGRAARLALPRLRLRLRQERAGLMILRRSRMGSEDSV